MKCDYCKKTLRKGSFLKYNQAGKPINGHHKSCFKGHVPIHDADLQAQIDAEHDRQDFGTLEQQKHW